MRTRKVLVATDGSSHAERAVRQLLVWMAEGNLPADGSDVLLGSVASGALKGRWDGRAPVAENLRCRY